MKDKMNHLYIVAHLLTAFYIFLLGWWSIILLPLAVAIFHAGQGAYGHRIFVHGAINLKDLSPRAHIIGQFLCTLSGWGSTLVFGSVHKAHHRWSGTEKDPHEPRYVGKWNMLWGRYDLTNKTDLRFFKLAYNRPYAAFFHKHYFTITWLAMPLFAPVFVVGFWLRYIFNVVVHDGDDEVEEGKDTSVNKWWWWPLLWGDEAHELHHRSSHLARHHKLDLIYWFVRLYQRIP